MTLQERIAELMRETGWSHADLMRVSGESSAVISQWRGASGKKHTQTIVKLEGAYRMQCESGFSALWLSQEVGPKLVGASPRAKQYGPQVERIADLAEKLPADRLDALAAVTEQLAGPHGHRLQIMTLISPTVPAPTPSPAQDS